MDKIFITKYLTFWMRDIYLINAQFRQDQNRKSTSLFSQKPKEDLMGDRLTSTLDEPTYCRLANNQPNNSYTNYKNVYNRIC